MHSGCTILVLGAGTGGIVAASLLRESLPKPHRIVVIDRVRSHYVGTTKTWVMAGQEEPALVTRSLDRLAARGIELVHAEGKSSASTRRPVLRKRRRGPSKATIS